MSFKILSEFSNFEWDFKIWVSFQILSEFSSFEWVFKYWVSFEILSELFWVEFLWPSFHWPQPIVQSIDNNGKLKIIIDHSIQFFHFCFQPKTRVKINSEPPTPNTLFRQCPKTRFFSVKSPFCWSISKNKGFHI